MSIAIITGASSGMGKEFVIQLEKYFNVTEIIAIARRKELLDNLKEYTSIKITSLPLDLSKEESFEVYKKFLEDKKPSVKLLINAAGFGKFEEFTSGDLLIHNNMVDLNCKALQAITYLTIPYMEKNSEIVEMASMSSIQPVPYIALYGATKAFVMSLSRSLNVELKKKEIHVTALLPFWVQTDFFSIANKNDLIKNFDIIYKPSFIIEKCFKHISKKNHKDICVPGKYARMQYRIVKILPHRLIMKIWLKKENIK